MFINSILSPFSKKLLHNCVVIFMGILNQNVRMSTLLFVCLSKAARVLVAFCSALGDSSMQ